MFKTKHKYKAEIMKLKESLNEQNIRIKEIEKYIETKKLEEKAEEKFQKQMDDFWSYDGTPQEAFKYD